MVTRIAAVVLKFRNRHFLIADIVALCLIPLLALALRTDGLAPFQQYWSALIVYTAVALMVRLAVFSKYGLYQRYWRFASIGELKQVVVAVLASTGVIVVLFAGVRFAPLGICEQAPAACGLPRSIPLIDALLVLIVIGGIRFSARLSNVWLRRQQSSALGRRVLVMGAGEAGAMMVNEMQTNPHLGLEPVGFIDDDLHKHDVQIRGLKVLGGRDDIPELARTYKVEQVIIAMPTASGAAIRDVRAICEREGLPTKTIPGMYELLGDTVSVNQLRDVNIEDLLRREPVRTEIAAVQELIRGRRVLVTGGGGSIGGELCRQVLRFQPAELAIVGHGENSVFEIYHELRRVVTQNNPTGSTPVLIPLIADIQSRARLGTIFEQYRPEIVFHAAAHKHVPLMEANPGEAVMNNIVGTRNVVEAALATDVQHFVMISTDKAVNPTSIMGASKRAAELVVQRAAAESGRAYVAVRFGNVLGSRGSVVLTFQKQIKAGGPVTVTDPDMRRFFMTIPEAVQLVLQASVLGQGGEVFVLDMGEPVKIVDLARDLIELSGLRVGEDIDIVFSGARPGEKLYEELFVAGEHYGRTRHEKIFLATSGGSAPRSGLAEVLPLLEAAALRSDGRAIQANLRRLIPEYSPLPAAGSATAGATGAVQDPQKPDRCAVDLKAVNASPA